MLSLVCQRRLVQFPHRCCCHSPCQGLEKLRREAGPWRQRAKSQRVSKVPEAMPGAGHRDCNLLAVLKLSLVLGLRGQSCLQISAGLEVWVRIGFPLRTTSLAAGRSEVWTCLPCLWLWPPEQGGGEEGKEVLKYQQRGRNGSQGGYLKVATGVRRESLKV